MRFTQVSGHFLILRGHSGAPVAKEADYIRRIHCDLRLTAHLRKQHIFAAHIQPARIDQRKASAHPFHIRINPVAGYARRILHDGNTSSCDFIEKS